MTFANSNSPATTASFSTSGTYVLQLSASDGASVSANYVTVTAYTEATPLRIGTVERLKGPPPALHLIFTAIAGIHYTVQYRDSLGSGVWATLADVATQPVTQSIEIFDPGTPASGSRYYRITSP